LNEQAQRYPLSWPSGWRRTPAPQRRHARFTTGGGAGIGRGRPLTVMDGIRRLTDELGRLGATHELLSTNVPTRLDGLPRSDQAQPTDPGVAVYFRLKGQPRALACDRWDRVADNIAAIAAHIEAIRAVDRYGVGTLDQAFAGYAALPATTEDWWLVLEIPKTATLVDVEEAFRRLAKTAHPDAGGSHEAMARLTAARTAARRALGSA
jgi:hypothetical protein